jgi:hypothetical protein
MMDVRPIYHAAERFLPAWVFQQAARETHEGVVGLPHACCSGAGIGLSTERYRTSHECPGICLACYKYKCQFEKRDRWIREADHPVWCSSCSQQ